MQLEWCRHGWQRMGVNIWLFSLRKKSAACAGSLTHAYQTCDWSVGEECIPLLQSCPSRKLYIFLCLMSNGLLEKQMQGSRIQMLTCIVRWMSTRCHGLRITEIPLHSSAQLLIAVSIYIRLTLGLSNKIYSPKTTLQLVHVLQYKIYEVLLHWHKYVCMYTDQA